MGLILLLLAGLPLVCLETLRWSWHKHDRRPLRKAFWVSASASVLWSLLGDYLGAVWQWDWPFYAMMATGAALCAFCSFAAFKRTKRRRRAAATALAFILVYSLTAWLVPDDLWVRSHDQPAAVSFGPR